MSNFFTNLATRSLAPTADLLQPSLPSLFEAPAGNEPVPEDSAGINPSEELTDAAPTAPSIKRSRSERRNVSENDRTADPQAEPKYEAPERQRVARQTILPFVPEESPRAPIRIQNEERSVAATTVRAEAVLNERNPDKGPGVEAVTRSASETNKSGSEQGNAARLVPIIPKLEFPHSARNENSMDAKMFPPEDRAPSVQIHIGRIEVRAVTQPSPPARSVVPNRPKMTLDEYLLRRNEGKR